MRQFNELGQRQLALHIRVIARREADDPVLEERHGSQRHGRREQPRNAQVERAALQQPPPRARLAARVLRSAPRAPSRVTARAAWASGGARRTRGAVSTKRRVDVICGSNLSAGASICSYSSNSTGAHRALDRHARDPSESFPLAIAAAVGRRRACAGVRGSGSWRTAWSPCGPRRASAGTLHSAMSARNARIRRTSSTSLISGDAEFCISDVAYGHGGSPGLS